MFDQLILIFVGMIIGWWFKVVDIKLSILGKKAEQELKEQDKKWVGKS